MRDGEPAPYSAEDDQAFNRLVEVQTDLARLSLRVRDLVNHGSLTKREIANRMGVSQSTVDRVLLKPQRASVEMLSKLVWAMGSRLDVQVGGQRGRSE